MDVYLIETDSKGRTTASVWSCKTQLLASVVSSDLHAMSGLSSGALREGHPQPLIGGTSLLH